MLGKTSPLDVSLVHMLAEFDEAGVEAVVVVVVAAAAELAAVLVEIVLLVVVVVVEIGGLSVAVAVAAVVVVAEDFVQHCLLSQYCLYCTKQQI